MSALQLSAAPALEPVNVSAAKAHLRIDHAADDALLADLISAARQMAELITRRALIRQEWKLWRDEVPASDTLLLPRAPLIEVLAVRTYDSSSNASVIPPALYGVDPVGGRLVLNTGASWPQPGRGWNGFEVHFAAGYGPQASDVPGPLRQGILAHVAHLYEHRGEGLTADGSRSFAEPPAEALALYEPYRVLAV